MVVTNGWTLFETPEFERQKAKLEAQVGARKTKDPEGWASSADAGSMTVGTRAAPGCGGGVRVLYTGEGGTGSGKSGVLTARRKRCVILVGGRPMRFDAILWDLDDDPDGNVMHCGEHGGLLCY